MSRAAGPALGVRRSALKWIVSECSLTRLGPSKVLVNTLTREDLSQTGFRMTSGISRIRLAGKPEAAIDHVRFGDVGSAPVLRCFSRRAFLQIMIGTTVAHYRILDKLGGGAKGVVHNVDGA